MKYKCIALVGAMLALGGCRTQSLTAGGKAMSTNPAEDMSECAHLGQVTGTGGGHFGGGYISDENLNEYAMNDLRNKAAKKGATHVIPAMGTSTSKAKSGTCRRSLPVYFPR